MEIRLIIMALICLCIAQLAFATESAEQRLVNLSKQLRCPECQNQSVYESNSSLATQIRAEIQTQIQAQKSDAEIRALLKARYGEIIFFRPSLASDTLLLWFGPLLLLLLGVGMFARVYRLRRIHA